MSKTPLRAGGKICVKYATEYRDSKTGTLTQCDYKDKSYTCRVQNGKGDFKKKVFKRDADFVLSRQILGLSLETAYSYGDKRASYNFRNIYNRKNRLVREKSEQLEAVWRQWDNLGRNTIGSFHIPGKCQGALTRLRYNDSSRTIISITNKGRELAPNGCRPYLYRIKKSFDGDHILKSLIVEKPGKKTLIRKYQIIKKGVFCLN